MSYSSTVTGIGSLYGYWRLGEASGTTMSDSSGNSRAGTYVNTPTLGVTGLLVGDSDTAASGTAGIGSVVDDNGLDGISALTIVCLVNASSLASVTLFVARDGGSSNRSFQFGQNAGKLTFVKIPAATASALSATTMVTGTTYHVAAVYNGTDIRLYINGALDGTPATASGSLGTVAQDLFIGRRNGGNSFLGTIDDVAVYTAALTSTQIASLYTAATTSGGSAASGSAAMSLSGSGVVAATGAGSGALALSGSGTTTAAATAAGSLSLAGSGAADIPGTTGAGSLNLSGSGATTAATTAAGALTLAGAGDTSAPAAGSGALALSGDGTASLPAGGAGSLTLSGSGTAVALLSYPDTVLADMTVGSGYWRLDETTGTTAADSSGGSHPGTYYGPPLLGELAAIPSGTAVGFNTIAVSDMEVPHYAGLDVTEFTLELWSKHDASYDLPIFSRLGGTLAPYGIWISPFGMAEVRIRTVSGSQFRYAGATSITNLLWRHVVATRDSSGTLSIYVDGALDAQFTGTPAPDTTTAYGLGVGTNGETRAGYFQADEAAFYPTALTSSQVATHYAAAGTASGGAGSLTLSGSGSVIGARSGGSLTLLGAGGFAGSAAGFGSIELLGDGAAVPLFSTDTSNAFDGLQLVCLGTVTIVRPAVTPPSNVAEKYDKALPYPRPVMVGGRPT